MKPLTGIDLILDNMMSDKWWRLINLTGMQVKLKTPVSTYAHPEFKGDRNFITINSYVISPSTNHYNTHIKSEEEHPPLWMYADNVTYSNELTPVNTKHSINLSLVDFDHFYNSLIKK